jgi:tRNA dimethylallyltransferase
VSAPKLLVVVGPTASGKTDLAVRLCESLSGEIITADSVQVYRHFDCGTGKPTPDERTRAVHHLIDVLDPLATMDAAEWAQRAESTLQEIRSRGGVPIVCGGSFLWVRALILGLAEAPGASSEVRARHRALVESAGRAALHAELAARDPASAARLNPNDFVRVSRALEVLELTGITMTQWQAEHGFRTKKHDYELIGVHRERVELDDRIALRAHHMLDAGWLDEVRELQARGFNSARAMGSVGYRQIAEALCNGPIERETLHQSIVRATRIFARRQRTWLRDEPVQWVRPEQYDEFLSVTQERRHEFIAE